jgi:hypothetical protein
MSECVHCGATDDEEYGIVVGTHTEMNENVCNVCRTEFLQTKTFLSERESQVAALKQLTGASHSRIAELLGIEQSTVDEYSRRLNEKAERAWVTADELVRFT